jgi:hypothetical protein
MDVRSYWGAKFDSDHYLVIAHVTAQIWKVKKITGARTSKYYVSNVTSSEVAEQIGNK